MKDYKYNDIVSEDYFESNTEGHPSIARLVENVISDYLGSSVAKPRIHARTDWHFDEMNYCTDVEIREDNKIPHVFRIITEGEDTYEDLAAQLADELKLIGGSSSSHTVRFKLNEVVDLTKVLGNISEEAARNLYDFLQGATVVDDIIKIINERVNKM